MIWETLKFKFGGCKYAVSFDDGSIADVYLPDGKRYVGPDPTIAQCDDIPPELATCPRFQRLVARKRQEWEDIKDGMYDEDGNFQPPSGGPYE